jgi:hypothetical protein
MEFHIGKFTRGANTMEFHTGKFTRGANTMVRTIYSRWRPKPWKGLFVLKN